MFNTIAIVGMGLIGGSIWKRLTDMGYPVRGYDINPQTRAAAREIAAATSNRHADRILNTIPAAVVGADLVIIAVATIEVESVLREIGATGYRGVLTDVTSIKAPVENYIRIKHPGTRWVGGHPIVGFERAGFEFSSSRLLDGCPWVLCIDTAARNSTALSDWLSTAKLLTTLGYRVMPMNALDHDVCLARISHIPHLVANAVARTAIAGSLSPAALSLAMAGDSFAQVTEVATTRPARTAEFCAYNLASLDAELEHLIEQLNQARHIMRRRGAVEALSEWFEPAYTARSRWPVPSTPPMRLSASIDQLLALGRVGGWVTSVRDGEITVVRPELNISQN
ncbi:MAG: prephenate dehydrogenase [Mycobacteriales bacterium]